MKKETGLKSLTINFVIFGAMRFGTNLLQEKLNYFKDILCLGELYNPTFVGVDRPHLDKFSYAGYRRNEEESRKRRSKDPFLLLEKVAEKAHSERKLVGFRMFNGHNHSVHRVLINDSRVKKIILYRDLVDSFVSLVLARQTGQWVKREDKELAPNSIHFDIEEFEQYVQENQQYFIPIVQRLEETGQEFVVISYQDVLDNGKIKKLARFVGSKDHMEKNETVLVKQNPADLDKKISNYEEVKEYLSAFNQNVFGKTK